LSGSIKFTINTNRAVATFSAASRRKNQTEYIGSPSKLNDFESELSKPKLETIASKSRKSQKTIHNFRPDPEFKINRQKRCKLLLKSMNQYIIKVHADPTPISPRYNNYL
jgi:hypothetical protein